MKNTMLLAELWNFLSQKIQKNFLAVFLFLFLFHFEHESIAQSNRPNIILILADDVGYKTLRCNGGNVYSTPNIDKLAKKGMRFTQCHASPLCSPSRVMLLTGKYNFRNYTNWGRMDSAEKTIGNMMKEAGYKTGFFGKDQLQGGGQSLNSWGFDEYCAFNVYAGSQAGSKYKNPTLYTHGAYLPDNLTLNKYGPDIVSDSLFAFIEQNKANPFFAFYPLMLVHNPFAPTPDDPAFAAWDPNNPSDTSFFKSMMSYMDKKIGELVNELKLLGIENNTVLLFAGDNGTPPQVIDYVNDDDSVILGGKHTTTEQGTHVPLIAYWPGTITPGIVNNDLIDFTDFLPSIAGIANIPVPTNYGPLDGVSFAPRLTGKSETPRNSIFCHYDYYPGTSPLIRWAQTTSYKLYDTSALKSQRLFYNISSDVNEKSPIPDASLTPQEAIIKQQLLDVINAYVAQGTALVSLNPSASLITSSSAIFKGTIKINGGSTVTASGVVWGTRPDPEVSSSNHTQTGVVWGPFLSLAQDLASNTTYYVRAYATNSAGTVYSDQVTFKTLLIPPVATVASGAKNTEFTANWKPYAGAARYRLDVSTSPAFAVIKKTSLTEDFKNGVESLDDWKKNKHVVTNTSVFRVSSAAVEFDASAAKLETPKLKGPARQLKFWIKGLSIDKASSLLLEGFNGISWTVIATLKNIPGVGTVKVYNAGTTPALDTNFIKFRFTYTKKGGTVVLDDVSIDYDVTVPHFIEGYRNVSVKQNSKTVNGLNPATTYYYRVRAETSDNISSNSNVIVATTKASSDIIRPAINKSDLKQTSADCLTLSAQVFPNPSSSEFILTVQTGSNENSRVVVRDADGKKVYQATKAGNSKYIFGKNFASGVYFVSVNSIRFNKTIKIIKLN